VDPVNGHYVILGSLRGTPSATIKSLAIKPTPDASGVGGRGLAQIIDDDGEILVEITNASNVKELVTLTP
jgi:hypothetical protein